GSAGSVGAVRGGSLARGPNRRRCHEGLGRARVAWSLALPIVVVGELAGRSLAYLIVAPDAHQRALLLARTGHRYLEYLDPFVGICLAACAVAVARTALAGFRRAVA